MNNKILFHFQIMNKEAKNLNNTFDFVLDFGFHS